METMKENAFFEASVPRPDGRMPLANLIENLARFKGRSVKGRDSMFIYPEGNLIITIDDNPSRKFCIARYNDKIVYDTIDIYGLYLGPWVDIVEAHRDEIEKIARECERSRVETAFRRELREAEVYG